MFSLCLGLLCLLLDLPSYHASILSHGIIHFLSFIHVHKGAVVVQYSDWLQAGRSRFRGGWEILSST
jgi:hypothetical protein